MTHPSIFALAHKGLISEPRARSACLRGLGIVEAVVRSAAPLTLDQIATATRIPKPTVHRLIGELVESGILLREVRPKTYAPGPRLTEMAFGALTNSGLRGARHAILRGLVDTIGETCNFTTLDGNEIAYIDRVEADWPLRLHLQPGSRVPIHCTSSGKLFLSQMPAWQRRRILGAGPLQRFTAKTITEPARLETELNRIRKSRISTDDEGFLSGLISVAVPVVDRRKKMIATVAVHAPSARLSLKRALEHVPLLQRASERLASLYDPPAPAKRKGPAR